MKTPKIGSMSLQVLFPFIFYIFTSFKKILSLLEKNNDNSRKNLFLEENHLKTLYLLLKEIPFFKKSFPQTEDLLNFIRHSSPHFHYEFFSKGSIIFHTGDQADKFFLILKGQAGVFVPQNYDEIRSRISLLSANNIPMKENRQNASFLSNQHLLSTLLKAPDVSEVPVEDYFRNSPEIRKKYFEDDFFIYKLIKVLGSQDCFGELALTNNKPRSATILAMEDLVVLTLLKEDFQKEFGNLITETKNKFEFFQKLLEINENESSSSSLMRVIYYFNEISFPPNQTIFHENDEAKSFFIIVSGEIEIFQTVKPPNSFESHSYLLSESSKKHQLNLNIAKLGAMNLLGAEDLIEEREKRSYSAISIATSKLYVISKKVTFYQKKEAYLYRILKLLVKDSRKCSRCLSSSRSRSRSGGKTGWKMFRKPRKQQVLFICNGFY